MKPEEKKRICTEGNEGNKVAEAASSQPTAHSPQPTLCVCPFCAHPPLGITSDRDPAMALHRVACRCGAMGPIGDTPESAAELWGAAKNSGDRAPELQTPADLLRAIYVAIEASKRISLPQLPEGVEGSNAIAMAEDLHTTLVAAQMRSEHQNVVESTETEEWGASNNSMKRGE